MPIQAVSASPAGGGSGSSTFVTTGLVENVTVALADTEQSHTFPPNTKSFMIKARTAGKIKMSFDVGTSGTVYLTVPPGAFYLRDSIDSPSTTIYFQSPTGGLVLELVSWT